MSKIALVTGGGSGIGTNVTVALAKDGWEVVIAGRRQEKLDEVIKNSPGLKIHAISADVTDEASVTKLFETLNKEFGRLDLLFNNAGMFAPSTEIDAISLEQWNQVVGVNLTGMFLCARESYRLMRDQKPMGGRERGCNARMDSEKSIYKFMNRTNSVGSPSCTP